MKYTDQPDFRPGDWVLVRKHCGTTRTQIISLEDKHAFVHYVCRDEDGHIYDVDGWVSLRDLQLLDADQLPA